MHDEPPPRLNWVQIRDAMQTPAFWQRGRLLCFDGDVALVQDDAGRTARLTCSRPYALLGHLAEGITDERGGVSVLWTVPGRMLAVPMAARCTVPVDRITISPGAVINEHNREFELLAGDASWVARIFAAEDRVELAKLAVRHVEPDPKPDRSKLFPKLRSRLLPEHRVEDRTAPAPPGPRSRRPAS
jgi:hypothetical protein